MSVSKPPKNYDSEERTLFLCGLPGTATDQKVRELLADQAAEGLEEIRVVKNEEGSKGYCYVQYTSPEAKSAAEALLLNQTLKIDGKRILIEAW